MNHPPRILAAVDFSKAARDGFDYALALSTRHGAELVVLQVVPLDQTFRRDARKRFALTATLRWRADKAGVELKERVQQGDPAEIILLHARSLAPDLIVMGTQQRNGLDRVRKGSVAERVVSRATSPVLLVPRRGHTNAVVPFNHVAVAVDFSQGSNRVVEQAMAFANDPHDRVTLLHVVPGVTAAAVSHLYDYGMVADQGEVMQAAQRRLQLAAPRMRTTPAAIHARVLAGDPTATLTQAVHDIGADLLVVGVPRRGFVSRTLFGSTAARLLRVTRVPLLAVPDAGMIRANQNLTAQRLVA